MNIIKKSRFAIMAIAAACLLSSSLSQAQDGAWRVSRTSGEVWVGAASAIQPVSLGDSTTLKSGDTVRTGRTGRVLLVRGEETIMVSPNSSISLPAQQSGGLRTNIIQQAGTILIQAEKRDERHFQVETPYLAAVVKGTQFRVTVDTRGANVNVMQGRVEVSDFKTGQMAMVLPGQAANVASRAGSGLKLSGTGAFNPIERGAPRATTVRPIPVPPGGLTAPASVPNGRQAILPTTAAGTRQALRPQSLPGRVGATAEQAGQKFVRGPNNALRITAPLGETNLNIHKVTRGLATAPGVPVVAGTVEGSKDTANGTIWSSGDLTPGNGAARAAISNSGGSAGASAGGGGGGGSSSSSASSASAASLGGTVSGVTSTVSTTVGSTLGTTGNVVSGTTNTLDSTTGKLTGTTNALTNGLGLKLGLKK